MFKRNKKCLVILGLLFIVSLPLQVHADIKSYKLEQGIPFIGGANTVLSYGDFNSLFQKFITAAYIIAAAAAFIKILIAGIRWYTSGGSPKAIGQSREDIKNGIIGLCFLFLAGVLLEFINPNLNKLSNIYSPNAGEECIQKGNTSGDAMVGTLAEIVNNPGYYADNSLASKLKSSGLSFNIGTACTKNDGSCDPNYCENDCHPCIIGGKCIPLTSVPCHFKGTCVDLTPYDSNSIRKLRCAGLDVFYEPKDGSCGKSTGTHLHVSLPSSGFIPENTTEKCWFPHQSSNSQYCQGGGGGGGGGY